MSFARRIAALTTVALTATGLGVVAAQPATAADDATFTWSFSDYLFNPQGQAVGFTSQTPNGGATKSATGIVFSGGEGTGSLEGGDLHVAYEGGVDFTWHATVGFSNPEVFVDGDEGRIVADVSWATPATGSADDVLLTTFDPATATLTDGAFSATPDWSTGSWASELLAALPDSVDAFFKASGSSSDARKAPGTFTAGVPSAQAAPAVTAAASYAGKAVEVTVSGTGFTAVTQPGDDGVYVALAPAGKFPETDDFEDQEKVASTKWVSAAQMPDGSFTVTLDPASRLLDPTTSYAVYTWQAHAHSNPSQDTETPVTIDFSKVGTAPKLKAAKKGKKLVVTVGKGAQGKVGVVFTKGKVKKSASARVKGGTASVALPKPKGTWKAAVTYTSTNAAYRSAKKTFTVKR